MRRQAAERQADVMRVLRSHERPMTAYEILRKLKDEEPGLAPPTIYRTLSALTAEGRAHKLESIKAFVPCRCDHAESVPVLAVCDGCGAVDEFDGSDLLPQLTAIAASNDFSSTRHIVELHGQCRNCTD